MTQETLLKLCKPNTYNHKALEMLWAHRGIVSYEKLMKARHDYAELVLSDKECFLKERAKLKDTIKFLNKKIRPYGFDIESVRKRGYVLSKTV